MNTNMHPQTTALAVIGLVAFAIVNMLIGLALIAAAIVWELALQDRTKTGGPR